MKVNQNWKYKDIMKYIEAMKFEYQEVSASFLWFEKKQQMEYIRNCKKQIYSLGFETWKKDKIWEYLNDFENIEVLFKFL